MPPTFGGPAPPSIWVVDTNASQDTGAACTGIGQTGNDGDALTNNFRIGACADLPNCSTDEVIIETDADLGTPP